MSQDWKKSQPKQPTVRRKKRRRYSLEFKQRALERMKECSSVTTLARELGIRRKFLYKWKQEFEEAASQKAQSAWEQEIAELQGQVAKLQQLSGRQALEIDFFRSALRRVEGTRQSKDSRGGKASTPRSGAGCGRKAG